MKAMILAAGVGARLRPYSLLRPKPLFPLLDEPLLQLTIRRLRRAGFTAIVVNTHFLRDQVLALLKDEKGVIIQVEDQLLGTGGGLRQAAPHFAAAPVLVTNGDIYHTVDLAGVYQRHCAAAAPVTMVVHDYPRFNKVAVDEQLRVTGFGATATGSSRLAFTGIQVIDPPALAFIARAGFASIIDCYRAWLGQGGTIRAEIAPDCFWTDIGTPADYLALHAGLLMKKVPCWPELDLKRAAGPFYIAPDAVLGKDVRVTDWVCVGRGARIGAAATLARAVIWAGAAIGAGREIVDTIVT